MKIDNGVELVFRENDFPENLFGNIEQIEAVMHKKMLENSRKEAESIAYALEYDKVYKIV